MALSKENGGLIPFRTLLIDLFKKIGFSPQRTLQLNNSIYS